MRYTVFKPTIRLSLSLSLILLTLSCMVSANPTALKVVGSGQMSWMLLPIYQATLKTANGRYQEGHYPQALEIRYLRDISRTALLEATDQQWEHLGLPAAQRKPWLVQLEKLWPDIKRGDRLQFQVDANLNNLFQHNGRSLGSLPDQAFSRQFLAIWLSPATSRPALRQQLITPPEPTP